MSQESESDADLRVHTSNQEDYSGGSSSELAQSLSEDEEMVYQDGPAVSDVEDTDEVCDENGGEEQHMTHTSSKGATRIRKCHSLLAQKRHSAP